VRVKLRNRASPDIRRERATSQFLGVEVPSVDACGSSECNISFVVAQKDMKATLVSAHRAFELGHAEFASAARTELV